MKNKLKVALLCLLSTASLMSCKDDKKEEETPKAPVIGVSHTIAGKIVDDASAALGDVTVALSGAETATTKSNSNGEFAFNTITKAGEYTLTLTKTGKFTTTAHVTIEVGGTKGISKFISLQMVKEGVTQTISTTGGEIKASDVTFTVPQGAMTESKAITITPINDIVTSVSAGKKELPLMTISCAPANLKFDQPCPIVIPNALTEYSFNNVKLLYFTKEGVWTNENMAAVVNNGATYTTEISHFSNYQIAFDTEIVGTVPSNEAIPAIESVDNLNGKGDIKVEGVNYKMKIGYGFETSPAQALANAGVTGADVEKLTTLITDAIASKNGGAKSGLSDITASYAVNTTIPKGVRLDISGTQTYNVTTYRIDLKKDNAVTPVTISVKVAGATTITTSAYTKEHQGGTAGQ